MLDNWKQKVRQLKREVYALYLAYQDPRTPLIAKIVVICVVGYALSPIDLIPDPIPILGQLDDLVLVPLGIALAIRLIPSDVLDECRQRAETDLQNLPQNRWVGAIIVVIWIAFMVWLLALLFPA